MCDECPVISCARRGKSPYLRIGVAVSTLWYESVVVCYNRSKADSQMPAGNALLDSAVGGYVRSSWIGENGGARFGRGAPYITTWMLVFVLHNQINLFHVNLSDLLCNS